MGGKRGLFGHLSALLVNNLFALRGLKNSIYPIVSLA